MQILLTSGKGEPQSNSLNSSRLPDGDFQSKRLARYPSCLSKAIAKCFFLFFKHMKELGQGPSGPGIGCALATRTPKVSSWSKTGSGERCMAILNETAQFGTGTILDSGQLAFYLHVDDGLVMEAAADPLADARGTLHAAADAFERIGFLVPDRREFAIKVIGYAPFRSPALVRVPSTKLARLHLALGELLSSSTVCIPHLHSLIGLWLWSMLLNRNLLSVAQSIFQFIERNLGLTIPPASG